MAEETMIDAHSSIQWGTLPAGIGTILTGLSLLLGFYIILRDRNKNVREQANELVAIISHYAVAVPNEPLVIGVVVQLTNSSNRSFFDVRFVAQPKDVSSNLEAKAIPIGILLVDNPIGPGAPQIPFFQFVPGKSETRLVLLETEPTKYNFHVHFRDGKNARWVLFLDRYKLKRDRARLRDIIKGGAKRAHVKMFDRPPN
jgi:hypothetical protein